MGMDPSFPVVQQKAPATQEAARPEARDMVQEFENFVREFGKEYSDAAEHEARFAAFVENLRFIEAENAKGTNSFRLGLTEFADMTREEFRTNYLGYRAPQRPWGGAAHLGTF